MVIVAAFTMILAHPGPVFYTGDVGPGASEMKQDEAEMKQDEDDLRNPTDLQKDPEQ
jgi:hypothetical protein